MNSFDYTNNKIVGYVDILPNSNANIEVVGYCDFQNDFHKLSEAEIVDLFPPRGRVFAHNFANRHYDLKGQLACISVKPNEKEGDYLDNYIWDKSEDVYEFSYKISTVRGIINEDGENNYNVFVDNDLIESPIERFVSSENRIYHIKAESQERIVSYWNEDSLDIILTRGKKFIAGYSLPDYDGAIDITTDDQLIEWYINKILKKKWSEILKEQSFKHIEPYVKETLLSLKGLPSSVMESRMERLKHINLNFMLTLDELQTISDSPWLSNAIDKSIARYKKEYLKDILANNEEELSRINEEHQRQIENTQKELESILLAEKESHDQKVKELKLEENNIIEGIDNKKLDLEILEESIESKTNELSELKEKLASMEARKSSIVEDFAVIRDVLSLGGFSKTNNQESVSSTFAMEYIDNVDSESIMFQAYKKSLENNFKINNIPHGTSSTIGDLLAAYNILLVPDVAIAKSIVAAAQKCFFMTEYVSANWKSFDDMWNEGFGFVVEHCMDNKDIMHFLILQNINLTYLPNYLQPLIDLQNGSIEKFPKYGVSFPENMRVICTITEDEVIPLNEKCLKYIGCVDPKGFDKEYYGKFTPAVDSKCGFLSASLLIDARSKSKNVPNFYKDYLDE